MFAWCSLPQQIIVFSSLTLSPLTANAALAPHELHLKCAEVTVSDLVVCTNVLPPLALVFPSVLICVGVASSSPPAYQLLLWCLLILHTWLCAPLLSTCFTPSLIWVFCLVVCLLCVSLCCCIQIFISFLSHNRRLSLTAELLESVCDQNQHWQKTPALLSLF